MQLKDIPLHEYDFQRAALESVWYPLENLQDWECAQITLRLLWNCVESTVFTVFCNIRNVGPSASPRNSFTKQKWYEWYYEIANRYVD